VANSLFQDLTGQKFNHLTAIKFLGKQEKSQRYSWLCQCECGKERIVATSKLISGKITKCVSCSKKRSEVNHPFFKNLENKKYGRLTVISLSHFEQKSAYWNCKCECGKSVVTRSATLNFGQIRSCGCLKSQHLVKNIVGQKFGKYLVVKRLKNSYWECECECGRVVNVDGTSLRSGNSNGCNACNKNGKLNPNYNPEITDEERKSKRNFFELDVWRKNVFERDDYTCQITGINGQINAHHIESWIDNPDLRFEMSNGITLNENIHRLFHKMYGYGNNTRKQFEEFTNKIHNKEINIENL
jgi:uncharacterized protein YlzI (FlbEa/FlbD family)